MAIVAVLTRSFKVDIESTVTPGTWIKIGGLNQVSLEEDKEDADTTDFDSGGTTEHIVAERSASATLEGNHKEDPVTGDRDAGQKAVEELARKTGTDSLGKFRITSPGGKTKTFKASAKIANDGSRNDPFTWKADLNISGPITLA